jgi:hypothetical protein
MHFDKGTLSMANEIKSELESGDGPTKADTMRRAISLLLNGEPLPHLFITVVLYVQSCDDHAVQKLLLLYLETVDKRDGTSAGRVLPEMILICQNLRNSLQSPTEYIRGVTLWFLCRLTEPELLEPLVPSVLANLEHRHQFVRRHAISAVSAIYGLPHEDQLIPDASEIIECALASEQDPATHRNVFLMLQPAGQDCVSHPWPPVIAVDVSTNTGYGTLAPAWQTPQPWRCLLPNNEFNPSAQYRCGTYVRLQTLATWAHHSVLQVLNVNMKIRQTQKKIQLSSSTARSLYVVRHDMLPPLSCRLSPSWRF